MKFEGLDFSSSKPLYSQISEIIEEKIIKNEVVVGQKLSPQRKLCKIFNVSNDTIQEAFTNLAEKGYISGRTRHGTFVISSEPKKGIDLKKKNEIGLIFCAPKKDDTYSGPYNIQSYHNKVILGIEKKLREKGLHIIYSTFSDELQLSIKEKDIAGLIVEGEITPKITRTIEKTGIPFVFMGDIAQKEITNGEFDVIAEDDFNCIYLATKHLTDLGHKRILYFIDSMDYSWDKEKFRGYKEALKEANIDCDKDLEIKTELSTFESGYNSMREFLDKSTWAFTGLVCDGELICYGAVMAIREKGIRIPEDVSVICNGLTPDFTSFAVDSEEIGRVATERLLKKIANPDSKPKRIIVPKKFIVRDSTRAVDSR